MNLPKLWPSPWELPHQELPHAALPLSHGWWRGPRIQRAEDALAWGLEQTQPLHDGSVAYRPRPGLESLLEERCMRQGVLDFSLLHAGSAAWVAARLASAACALRRRPSAVPAWMAILNLTPDSFSDGGQLGNLSQVKQAAELAIQHGASWLDLGAESTRPGATDVPADEQLGRLIPALRAVRTLNARISIDTRSAQVAEACLKEGADAINDVSALSDSAMAEVCARFHADAFLMHMRGTPANMRDQCDYKFLFGEVADEWMRQARKAISGGVAPEQIYFDPGIGFAKTAEQSMRLIAHLGTFRALGFPILAGPSRKSFQSDLLPERDAAERDCGTAGAAASCILQGAQVVRLHCGDYWDAARVAAGIERAASATNDLEFTSTL